MTQSNCTLQRESKERERERREKYPPCAVLKLASPICTKIATTTTLAYEVSLFSYQFSCLRTCLLDAFPNFHLHVLILKIKELAIE
ncbi:hypothetical protein RJT34_16528 [Clitoria ternatea]|uniref:Uncharacterized protein n=1 Tax=Clitoria ternatea TaxID=43366 RepID=A0AAN9J8U2_CLITE